MKIFNVLIMCLFSGLTFTIALPATSETEGTAVSTSVIPTETPGPDDTLPMTDHPMTDQ